MQFLLDHALAVVCSAALIIGALTLQTQGRIHAVQETIQGSARSKAGSFTNVVTQEFDNVLSESQTRAMLGTYRCILTRDPSNSFTSQVEVPAFIRASPMGDPVPAHVRYQMVASGDSVLVAGDWVRTYQLERSIDEGSGYGSASVIAVDLVDFDVTFRGRAATAQTGAPPIRFSQIAMEFAVALPDVDRDASALNVARLGLVVRPPNLTVGT